MAPLDQLEAIFMILLADWIDIELFTQPKHRKKTSRIKFRSPRLFNRREKKSLHFYSTRLSLGFIKSLWYRAAVNRLLMLDHNFWTWRKKKSEASQEEMMIDAVAQCACYRLKSPSANHRRWSVASLSVVSGSPSIQSSGGHRLTRYRFTSRRFLRCICTEIYKWIKNNKSHSIASFVRNNNALVCPMQITLFAPHQAAECFFRFNEFIQKSCFKIL